MRCLCATLELGVAVDAGREDVVEKLLAKAEMWPAQVICEDGILLSRIPRTFLPVWTLVFDTVVQVARQHEWD